MNRSSKITIAAILVIGVFSISIMTIPAFAEWDKTNYPKIQGTIPADNSEQKDTIALSVAMAVGENSVSDGKAVYGKLTDVNEFLVYKVVVITDDHAYYKILVDAGNGEALYVSDMIKKDNHKKISDKKHSDKAKKHFKGMSDEQITEKKRQFKEMGDAFRSLSLQDRAALILHFMQMKLQWDGMSEDEKAEKRLEMKAMFKEYLPLTAEEKKQKLQAYIQSLN
jgi:RNA polymerase-interacting CarD/CdnL/TRCF family regulator|tara:strand:+ start:338 stop:1009 length:672 start_codon:yes stop_codon:yes gene_type:complete